MHARRDKSGLGLPLRTSRKILVQAATRDQPHGFQTEPADDGFERITQLGGYPLNVEKIKMNVTLKDGANREAMILDENGYPTDRRPEMSQYSEGRVSFRFPDDAVYLIITL